MVKQITTAKRQLDFNPRAFGGRESCGGASTGCCCFGHQYAPSWRNLGCGAHSSGCSKITIVFLGQHNSETIAQTALAAGALVYVTKSSASTDLIRAVEAVSEGRPYCSGSFSSRRPFRKASARHRRAWSVAVLTNATGLTTSKSAGRAGTRAEYRSSSVQSSAFTGHARLQAPLLVLTFTECLSNWLSCRRARKL